MGGKCESISRPADEVNWGLRKKQRARLARALRTARTRVPLLCLEVRGAAREENPGLILLLAGSTHQRPAGEHRVPGRPGCPHHGAAGVPAASRSPRGFFGAHPGPLPLSSAPSRPGHWVAVVPVAEPGDARRSPKQGGSPCSCQGHPKGRFTRRQHGPRSSPHGGVSPPWAEGGQRPPSGCLTT